MNAQASFELLGAIMKKLTAERFNSYWNTHISLMF